MDIGRRHALGLLAGLAAAMALTPDNDQFSQFLRLAFFRSPNYQAGVSGWTINQDGSAEFNNLTIRGTFNGNNFILNSSGLFIYSGTPALGNLIASIAPVAGTDQFGNAYAARFATYGTGITSQMDAGGVNIGSNAQIAGTGGAAPGRLLGTAGGGSTSLTAGKTAAGDVDSTFQVLSKNGNGGIEPIALLAQALVLGNVTPSGPEAAAALYSSNGNAKYLGTDGNAYGTGRLILPATATPQTISSTSATTITGCSAPVAAAKYAFKARVHFHGGSAAGTANFSVTGPANTGPWIGAIFFTNAQSGIGEQNGALGPVISPTLTTQACLADIEGEVTFTAAGTIALACAEGTSGDTVIIDKAHFWLFPV